MNQTFYIDVEEEISSVVDRLNKSMSVDNYFVVPKRALFLQSIVNLKLLKREAEKVGKRVIIVTQDEVGSSMAQRCEIETRQTIEGLDTSPDRDIHEDDFMSQENNQTNQNINQQKVHMNYVQDDKKIRLSGVGSNDYYDDTQSSSARQEAPIFEKNIQAATKLPINGIKKRSQGMSDFKNQVDARPKSAGDSKYFGNPQKEVSNRQVPYAKQLDPVKERNVEKMFSKVEASSVQSAPIKNIPPSNGKTKKVFLGFFLICFLVFLGIGGYLFFPSAKISIDLNVLKTKNDISIVASKDFAEIENQDIPLRVIEREEKMTLANDVSGTAVVSGKKAHGTVTIYNEFSGSPQTLVATTRFESPDKKIFRLIKNVIVPGSTSVGGQTKPGVITAEVVADQAGQDYNISSADFKIPGFAGSPKYDKFYAKSTENFSGGMSDGQTASGGALSQKDIDSAKIKTETALKEKISEILQSELSDGEKVLPQAIEIVISRSLPMAKVGDVVSSFDYSVSANVRALIFSENDVNKVLLASLKNENEKNKQEITKIDYAAIEPDFGSGKMNLRIYSEITTTPEIEIDQIKKELLGKRDDQLNLILRKYPDMKNINVEFAPSFVSRIPQYEQRVSLDINGD